MCQSIEIKKDALPSNISIEFERDVPLRATEIFIINHDREGNEKQVVKIIASDNGKTMSISPAVDLVEGVAVI